MEVALTFGSVGDIIQLCNLAVKLGRALGEAPCDSAKEYRGLQRDIDIAVRVLSRVADAYSENSHYPQLNNLDSLTEEVIRDCERSILEFLDRWEEKYEDSLGTCRPARKMKRVWRSLEWSVRERDRVQALRNKLNQTVQTVTLLGNLALQGSARVDRARIMAGTEEVNNHIGYIHRAVVSLETAVSEPALRKALDPTKNMPLFLEGASWETIEIPLNLIHSWEMFENILAHQFEHHICHNSVVDHQYVLEEIHTGQEVDRSLPLESSMRRGMRIRMGVDLTGFCIGLIRCPHWPDESYLTQVNSGKRFQMLKESTNGDNSRYPRTECNDPRPSNCGSALSGPQCIKLRLPFRITPRCLDRLTLIPLLSESDQRCAECAAITQSGMGYSYQLRNLTRSGRFSWEHGISFVASFVLNAESGSQKTRDH